MGLKKFKPITPGSRFKVISDFKEITKSTPEKSLLSKKHSTGGRNNQGIVTNANRGGGHKQKYRIVDFKRDKFGIPAKVEAIEYDPNRTARIALLFYADGEKRYIIAPDKLQVGMTVISGEKAEPTVGNTLYLKDVPLGAIVHNIELYPGRGGCMARGAGTFAQLAAKEGQYVVLKMPSGEVRRVLAKCLATIGSVGNTDHGKQTMGKAGRNRWKGLRPRNRGVVMNPVDHPMGGGEGRASGGHPRSRRGIPAKGYKTRSPKKKSWKLIIERRKTGNQ